MCDSKLEERNSASGVERVRTVTSLLGSQSGQHHKLESLADDRKTQQTTLLMLQIKCLESLVRQESSVSIASDDYHHVVFL